MTVLRMRRVRVHWPMRRRYEVELGDDAGGLVRSVTTPAPSAFLVKQAGVHTTDLWDWVRAADREFVRGSGDWITSPFVEGSQHATTRFVGVELDEVRAANTGLYEVTTTAGVPVRLHDMSLTRLAHDAAARTLVMEFLYDDPDWTPPEAEATPVAVFTFDDVEIVEQRDEPAEAADSGGQRNTRSEVMIVGTQEACGGATVDGAGQGRDLGFGDGRRHAWPGRSAGR